MTSHRSLSTHRGQGVAFKVAIAGGILACLAALSMAGAGPTFRLEMLSLGEAFSMLRYGAFVALAAAGLGAVSLLIAAFTRRALPAVLGSLVILAGLALVAVPWLQIDQARSVPPIHDITTDLEDPPAFEALVEARKAAPNAVAYPGETTAKQQREGYPALGPLVLKAPLSEVQEAVEAEAREAGWEIAAVSDSRLEATDTTFWFGFKDDVVIRLRETADGVRVDMRSASRLGTSDVGTNASRIRATLDALEARVSG
ncbi:DUF1499 domain-containing protein [Halomonas saccharevitans]|uniref:DUF1499 domain-containing protein n=1 Tax=Halomonas saccharevitans TaxID=416872 RepID=A0A1I7C5X3_9GAMM|nr:DUF1499 domain-containing protein [Halomonas saccharevitans]SFT94812.1 Protein of unknown function [Halomonas saccharevitans]